MSSKLPWIDNVLKSWTRSKSGKARRRPFHKYDARLWVEQLEIREVLTGAISLSGGALALMDAGTPTITVDLTSNNYTVTDSKGLSGTIPGWNISGNTATEMDGLAGSITHLNFTTTNGSYGNMTTGIAAAPSAVVTINDAAATIGATAVTIDNLAGPNSTTLNIPSGDTLTVNSTTSTNFAGNLTGAGNLAVTGTSTFTLSGSNSITGTTTVSSGALEAAAPGALAGYNTLGKITVADGATLAVQFGGTGQFAAADVTTLLTDATFTDGAGTATLGLDVTGSNTATYSSVIADPGDGGSLAVEKLGSGTLTFSGANSFTGGLTVQAGTFIAGVSDDPTHHTGAAGQDITTIQLGTAASTSANLEAGTFTVTNPINVGTAGTLTVSNDGGSDDAYFSGAITFNGNGLTISTTGTSTSSRVIASGAISGTGNLVLNNSSAGGSIWIGFPPPSDVHAGPPQSPNDINNTGKIINNGTSTGLTTISNTIKTNVTGVHESTSSLTASPLVLAGANTFTSGVFVDGGTVDAAQDSSALGAATNLVTLGATSGSVPAALLISTSFLTFTNPIQLASNVNLSGVGGLTIGSTQAVTIGRPSDAQADFSGGVSGSNNLTINVAGNGNLNFNGTAFTLSGTITNDGSGLGTTIISSNLPNTVTGITESGKSTLILSGTNTNTGNDTLTAGELSVGTDANLGNGSSIVFNGGTLQLTGTTLTSAAAGMIGSHPYSIVSGKTVGFDINNPANTFTISDALTQGAGGLTKLGGGTLVLTNANTYTGVTLIDAGTLQLGNGGTTGTLNPGSAIVDNSTVVGGNVTLASTFVIDRSTTVTQGTDFSGSGIGAVSLTGNTAISLSGAITNHSTTVSGLASTGLLAAGMFVKGTGIPAGDTIATIASGSSITLATAATSTRTSTLTFSLAGSGGIASGTTVNGLASTALLASGMAVSGAGIPAGDTIATIASATSITLSQAATAIADGVALTFTETGGFANSGSGTTILTAANTYSGPTSVYDGVLQVGNGGANGSLGTGPISIGSGNLVFDLSSTVTVPNVIQNVTGAPSGGSAPATTVANPGHDMVQMDPTTGLESADTSINMHDEADKNGQDYAYHWGATGSDRPGQIPVLAPFNPIAVQAVGNTTGSGALFYVTTNESSQFTSATPTTVPVSYMAGSNTVTLTSGTIAGFGIGIGQVVEGAGIVTVPTDVNGNGGPGLGTSPTGTFVTSVDTVHNTFTLNIAPTASGTSLLLPAMGQLQASGIGGVQIVSGGGNTALGQVPYTASDVGKILTVAQGQGTFSIGSNSFVDGDGQTTATSLTPNQENYANPNVTPAEFMITQVTGGAITGVELVSGHTGAYQPYSPVLPGDQTFLIPTFTADVSGNTLTLDSYISGTDAPYAYGFNLAVGQTVTDTSTGTVLGTIVAQATGNGGIGSTYTLSQTVSSPISADSMTGQTQTTFTGSISANVLTVDPSSVSGSPLVVGDVFYAPGVPVGTAITKQLSGTPGADGTYQLATLTGASLNVSDESMTAQLNQTLTTASGAQLPIESNMLSPALIQPTALDPSDQNGAPSGYGSALGHEVVTAYEMVSAHELYAPLTGDTVAGNFTIDNVVDNSPAGTPYAVGFAVDGPGIPAGDIITGISGSTITLSQAVQVTGTGESFDSWNEWTGGVINGRPGIDANTIANGGSGYTDGETVVAVGGVTAAGGAPLLGTVSVSGGVVVGFTASDATNNGFQGDAADSANWYSVLPTVPCPVTGGSGTGNPLFNLTMNDPKISSGATGIGIATVVSGHGGSGYHLGDVLTLAAPAGVTPQGTAATLTVTAVDGSGAILAVNVKTAGSYTAYNPATLFYVAPLPGGSSGSGAILSWQALQTSVPDNASSALSPDAAVASGGGYSVGDVLVVTSPSSWTDSSGHAATWLTAPILQVTHYTYSSSGASFTYNVINTPVSSTGAFPLSSDTFNVFPLGYTPSTTIIGPNNYYGAGINGGVAVEPAGATVNFGPQVFGKIPGSVIQEGSGTTILTSANTYTGATQVSGGTLQVNSTIASSSGGSVSSGATLDGIGGTVPNVNVTGTIQAGAGTTIGSLTTGSMTFSTGGVFQAQLNGTTPGTGYDQVTANGPIALNGATLQINVGPGFNPALGTKFDILVNTSGAAPGTFAGLAEGATVTASNGAKFTISYVGGSGHDVVLTYTQAGASSFVITAELPVSGGLNTTTAGSNFIFEIQAQTSTGTFFSAFSGTVSFSTTDPHGTVPAPTMVTGGIGFFLGTLDTASATGWTISASDAFGGVSGTSSPIAVTPGAAAMLAFGTQPTSTATGNTLAPVTVQIEDAFGNVVTSGPHSSDAVTVSVASGPGGFTPTSTTTVSAVNGVATFSNLALPAPGTYTLGALIPQHFTGLNSNSFKVTPLQVVPGSFVGTPSGFSLQFNTSFLVNSQTPVLYGQGFGASAPVPSVTLTQILDASGNPVNNPVEGSLVLNSANNAITFVATNTAYEVNTGSPVLPDGTYTVDLRSSGTTGFQGLLSGSGSLDGLGTGTPGSGDFTTTFTVHALGKDAVWVPATADGPGQPLEAPGNNQIGGGYPVYLNDSAGTVTNVLLTVTYNPNLLTVTGVTGANFTLLPTSVPGQANLEYNGPVLTSGSQVPLGFITASVPKGSAAHPVPYKAKDLLHLSNVSINSGSVPVVTSDGVHVVAYVGDADGNGAYSSSDAVLITRVGLQTDTGFTAYPLVDPVIVADTDGSGFIPADAALQINEAGVGFMTSNLPNPPIPAGVVFVPIGNNVDPTVSIPSHLQAGRDGTVSVPVNLDDAHPTGSTGLTEAHLALTYNPQLFTVSAADIHLGSLLAAASGWTLTPTINATTGEIAIALSSSTPVLSSVGGSLVTIDFHTVAGFPGGVPSTAISLVSWVNPTGSQVVLTELGDAQGTFTLSTAPTNGFDPRIDGVVVGMDAAAVPVAPVGTGSVEAGAVNLPGAETAEPTRPVVAVESASVSEQEDSTSLSSSAAPASHITAHAAPFADAFLVVAASLPGGTMSGVAGLGVGLPPALTEPFFQALAPVAGIARDLNPVNTRLSEPEFDSLLPWRASSTLDNLNWDQLTSDLSLPTLAPGEPAARAGRADQPAAAAASLASMVTAVDQCFMQDPDDLAPEMGME